MKKYIVKPKLLRKKSKHILLTCGEKGCNYVSEICYTWDTTGKYKFICPGCGRMNQLEIPINFEEYK